LDQNRISPLAGAFFQSEILLRPRFEYFVGPTFCSSRCRSTLLDRKIAQTVAGVLFRPGKLLKPRAEHFVGPENC
jgi:hypothetical protein